MTTRIPEQNAPRATAEQRLGDVAGAYAEDVVGLERLLHEHHATVESYRELVSVLLTHWRTSMESERRLRERLRDVVAALRAARNRAAGEPTA